MCKQDCYKFCLDHKGIQVYYTYMNVMICWMKKIFILWKKAEEQNV